MGPPCTPFASWSHLNRKLHPESWGATRKVCEILADVAAHVAMIQLRAGRHFVIENPDPSDIWHLDSFLQLWNTGKVGKVTFPQCALGLQVDGEPILKRTTLWASHPLILHQFTGLRCTCERHGELVGKRKTVAAAIYPLEMCRRLVAAFIEIIKEETMTKSSQLLAYPTTDEPAPRKRGRPRKYPEFVEFDCPACKVHRPKEDSRHTRREEPPLLCKYPHDDFRRIFCPACVANKPADHPDHTYDETCRMPSSRVAGRRRRGGSIRDPSMPAHGDSTGRRRQNEDHDFDHDVLDPNAASSGSALPAPQDASAPADQAPPTREEIEEAAGPTPSFIPEAIRAAPTGTDADTNEQREAEPGIITALRPQTAREMRLAAIRLKQTDTAAQASASGQEDWRSFDTSKALTALRSPDAATRRKALQRLHLRWWHAGTSAMKRTLAAAGAPTQALAEIDSVVQACAVCRRWTKPTERTITSYRLVFVFNEEVQMDLVFIRSEIEKERGLITVLHLVDVAVRWGLAAVAEDKTEETLCRTISTMWVSIFGPMQLLVIDHEAGMTGFFAADWASSQGISFKFKAPRQKAWIVERHNELLRNGIHTTETQCLKEGIYNAFESTVAIVNFSLNALTVINTSTPYNAVLGRQPPMLPPIEGGYRNEMDEALNRPGARHRHEARVREIACTNIIEYNAKKRVERALAARTQHPIEAHEYQPGELVDA